MSVTTRLSTWFDRMSDGLSPLVVKEARQIVRGREFLLSFLAALVAGMLVAFGGATEALSGSSTAGRWTFAALIGCLAFLGLGVVPLGAFTTLRQERAEQTLELITLTSLSSRGIVIGKLLAQGVKLLTLFAAIAPFLTMSFLLGGIDFTTVLISLVLLYMGSVWAGALCLFLSTLFRSRAASGLVFVVVGLFVLFLLIAGLSMFQAASRGFPIVPTAFGLGTTTEAMIKGFAILLTFWTCTVANFVLLAENRLSLATEDTVTPLRVGFFVQFLAMAGWAILFLNSIYRADTPEVIGALGSIHLAIVAIFVVTEDMSVPRRVLQRMRLASGWRRLLALFGPGAGRGAAYILVQMVILATVVAIFQPPALEQRKLLVSAGYICFFTGVPVLAFWRFAPAHVTQARLRVAVLCTVAASLVVPDIIHYLIFQPEVLDLSFGSRHLLNPFRTIAEWDLVDGTGLMVIPLMIAATGLLAYVRLISLGARATAQAVLVDPQAMPVEGEPGRGGILY